MVLLKYLLIILGLVQPLEILLIVALQQTMEVEITQHLFQIICLMQIGVLQLGLI